MNLGTSRATWGNRSNVQQKEGKYIVLKRLCSKMHDQIHRQYIQYWTCKIVNRQEISWDWILWTLPLRHNTMPTSIDAIGDQYHFLVQWLVKFYPSHFLRELQPKEIGPGPQMGTKLQLSKAAKMLSSIMRATQKIIRVINSWSS